MIVENGIKNGFLVDGGPVNVYIHSIIHSAEGVLFFELRPADGDVLPSFEAGAHIDIYMPGGLSRSYSLLNDSAERHRYVIGVQRNPNSRGGSSWMHESTEVGGYLTISAPSNNFPLYEAASHSVFIAGGIGITPLWCMIQRLNTLGRSWSLFYGARSRKTAALINELIRDEWADRITLRFDDESQDKRLDISNIIRSAPSGAHFYCCGPTSMLAAFETACLSVDPRYKHLEYFGSSETLAMDGNFLVLLARCGREIPIHDGQTILEALQIAGIDVPSSCQQGVCGVCETRVIAGIPDHRDMVLSDSERASNKTMMICCSRSLTPQLTLDL